MDGWNTTFLLGRPIFRGYVSFREGSYFVFIILFHLFRNGRVTVWCFMGPVPLTKPGQTLQIDGPRTGLGRFAQSPLLQSLFTCWMGSHFFVDVKVLPKFGMVLSNHKYVYICVSFSFEIVKLLSGLGKSWMLYHVIWSSCLLNIIYIHNQ